MKNNGNLAESLRPAEKQLLFQHDPETTQGWITLARKDPQTKRFVQHHYKPNELACCLADWTGEDIYYSQNSFFKPQRRIDNIRQLRSLFVDLDVYNKDMTPDWVLGKLELEYFRQEIPEPNMVIFSGRGLVLVWNIEPLPYMAMPLWRAVENHFAAVLKDLGADTKATDPARIFRLAGTINSKSGTSVRAEFRHEYRYDIHDLQHDYLPEITAPKRQTKSAPKGKVVNLFNLYSLHLSRAKDIARLVELREGKVTGHRETICFLYRYFTCCCSNDPERALEDTLSLNSEFTAPLPTKEVKAATKSAEKAWKARSDEKADAIARAAGYPGAGYNIKTSKLIDWLDITEEEQKEMLSIIGQKEKNRRRRVKYREENGPSPKEKKVEIIRQAIEANPDMSSREISELTGIPSRTVRRIKATL